MRDYYDKVKAILEERPETRDDDMKLYAIFIYKVLNIPNVGFYNALYNHEKYGLPSYESITRVRRKIQELEPSLCGKKRKRRLELEEEYRQAYSPINNRR